MMKIQFLILSILLLPFYNYAQNKSANIWCFGDSVELDFNSGVPVFVTGCLLRGIEGCASIADKNTGQLLFYTDGSNVWNRNNSIMPNNTIQLGGNQSSSQSALIIPKPGSNNLYYLFTVGAQAGYFGSSDSGVHYSVIDMNLNGGLGDMYQQPIELIAPTTEKIVATKMANGQGYWMVTHRWRSNAFYAYPITSVGIGTPVISNIGIVQTDIVALGSGFEATGYMKISPDGTKIADAVCYMHTLQVLNFDNVNGQVLGTILCDSIITNAAYGVSYYGISFSPNSNLLYGATIGGGLSKDSAIYQYDLTAGNPDSVLSSRNIIGFTSDPSALQMAPDGKIYVGEFYHPSLSTINNPNVYGTGCNFQPHAISFNYGRTQLGLPNMIDSDFLPDTTSGINNVVPPCAIHLSPNPVSTLLTIQCENFQPQQIVVYDLNGEKISEQKYAPQLDVSALARGIYFIALKNAETTVRKKFVKM